MTTQGDRTNQPTLRPVPPPLTTDLRTGRVIDTQRGDHYGRMKMQPLEFILANDLDFIAGNVIKYVARGALGNDPVLRATDLRKAQHYLDIMIAEHERRHGK